jgi:hypothetical protein
VYDITADAGLKWRTASQCGGGNCVLIAELPDGRIAMRDSKQADGPILAFDVAAWRDFVSAVRSG